MGEHPNAELLRRGYDAFVAGDAEWMAQHLHDNVVWHEPGNNFLSGDYKGREEVLAHFAKQVSQVLPEFSVHDVVANDDHAIALITLQLRRLDNQDTFEGRYAHIVHVDAERRALESWVFNEDQSALDHFLEGLS